MFTDTCFIENELSVLFPPPTMLPLSIWLNIQQHIVEVLSMFIRGIEVDINEFELEIKIYGRFLWNRHCSLCTLLPKSLCQSMFHIARLSCLDLEDLSH